MQKKRFEVLKVAYKEAIHVMKFALRIYDCAMQQTKEYTFPPRNRPTVSPSACDLHFPFLYLAPTATLSSGAYSSHLLFRRKQESIVEPIVQLSWLTTPAHCRLLNLRRG
jgi:hypothetical protein